MVLVTSSHPAVVPVVSTTDQALAPSGEAGVATSPSPTGLGAGDKCASFVVHAAFNILVYGIQEMVFNFEQLMELLCSCTGHAPGICWLADEAMALYNTIDDELIPMTRLKCLPCTDLYAPFEL
eukprot:gene16799-9598_t